MGVLLLALAVMLSLMPLFFTFRYYAYQYGTHQDGIYSYRINKYHIDCVFTLNSGHLQREASVKSSAEIQPVLW